MQAELESSGLSPAEAKANLVTQEQASQVNLVAELEEELGDDYAGVWFDAEAGEFVAPIATAGEGKVATEAGERAVEREFRSAALAAAYRTEVVRYSDEELKAAQKLLNEGLASLSEVEKVQTGIDPQADALKVRIAADIAPFSKAKIEAMVLRSAVRTELETVAARQVEVTTSGCTEAEHRCDLPVRGGEKMWGGPPWVGESGLNEVEYCTVGFRANGNDGRKYILTAGHCVHRESDAHKEVLWSWETADSAGYYHYIGRTSQWHFPGRDWAKIDATGTWADTPPWPTQIAYWGSTSEYPVVGEASPYVGQTLCHVGAFSGSSCGQVMEQNVTEWTGPGEEVSALFRVEGPHLSVEFGDSGGPIVANNIALGVVSTCNCIEEKYGPDTMYFDAITEATAELGVNIAGQGAPEVITGSPATGVGPYGATVPGQVDPHGLAAEYAVEYGVGSFSNSTSYAAAGAGQGFVPVSRTITGLEPATTYQYRVTAFNGFGTATGNVGTFRTAAVPPVAGTIGTEGVKKSSATLLGLVNPVGEPTTYQFEYGTTTSYGSVAPATAGSAGSGRVSVMERQAISGLKVGTTYHFRIRATNSAGTSYGSDQTFKTPEKPVVTAEAAGYVNTLEPALRATINPERAETKFQFEYGTTEAYGTKIPATAESAGSGAPSAVEKGLKGLKRSTTYHYRVVAENEVGTVYGADRSFTTLPPCKGAEAKCAWSLQEAANPVPPDKFEMKSVSCSSSTLCVAVGKDLYSGRAFAERWNGSTWSLIGSATGEMKHVFCLGSGCFAVGVSSGAAATWSIAEFPAGKGSWAVTSIAPALPAGASETVLRGVSCSGESACTAVGSYKGSEGTYHPLVERWNGSSWALQSAPNPAEGTAQNVMLSVSCISLGCITVGEAAGKPVAETWVSGTWAIGPAALPAGAKGGRLSTVSCTGTSCVAAGQSNEGTGTEKPLIERMENLSWSLMSAPVPTGSKGFAELAGVSCASASACTAVGYYATSVTGGTPTELKTLAEAWNGSAWTVQSTLNPAGHLYSALTDVSCSAAGACTAAGGDSATIGASPESLIERWNGSAWSTQAAVDPEEPVEAEVKSVSCVSNALCLGVGRNLLVENSFASVWNGTQWQVVANAAGELKKVSCFSTEGCFAVGRSGGSATASLMFRSGGAWGLQSSSIPLPTGSTESVLDAVSCEIGLTTCTAVGSYKGSEGTYHPLVERWNGSSWALQSAPNPTEGNAQNAMLGVSCAGASPCMAVGEAAGKPVAEIWTGGVWTLSAPPKLPTGAKGGTFAAVSCGSSSTCMAVGDSLEGAGSEKALAERWNEGAWSISPAAAPAGAKGFVNLTDVACLSPNACFAAGSYAPEVSGGAPVSLKSLGESWDGTEWSVLTTPNLGGKTFNALAGISCSTSIDCTAVGGATSSITKRPVEQLVMRFE